MHDVRYTITNRTIRLLVTKIIFAVNVGWLAVLYIHEKMAAWLVHEDGIVQWIQVLFLLLSASFFWRISLKDNLLDENKIIKYTFFVLLILTLLAAGEEISWGQRIFDIETPGVIRLINVQDEITLHNLWFFQRFRHWSYIIVAVIGLILIYQKTHKRIIEGQLEFIIPPGFFKFALYFILISGLILECGCIWKTLFPGPLSSLFRYWAGRYSEIGELSFSLTLFAYAAHKYNCKMEQSRLALSNKKTGAVSS